MTNFIEFDTWFLEKLKTIIMNTILNSIGDDTYNFMRESLLWARKYFPMYSPVEFIELAERYDVWMSFKKEFLEGEENDLQILRR